MTMSIASDDGGIPRSNIVALPPPSYEDVLAESVPADPMSTTTTTTSARLPVSPSSTSSSSSVPPPPSYDALYGRVSEARNKLTPQVFGYMQTTCACFPAGTVTVLIYIIPLLMIILGSVYVHDCPQGKFIPGWMIIAGFIWLIKPLLRLTTLVRKTPEEQRLERHRQRHTRQIVNAFMLGWFVIGTYFVYRIGTPNYDPARGPHCARPLYEFAFVLFSAVYAAVALMVAATLLIVALTLCMMGCSDGGGGGTEGAESGPSAGRRGGPIPGARGGASMV